MRLFDLSRAPDNEERFPRFMETVQEEFSVDYVSYAATIPSSEGMHIFTTYPESWKRHYNTEGLHRFDPALLMASRSIAPVDWARLAPEAGFRRVFDDARDFGLPISGLTIPVRGPFGDCGLFSVASRCSGPEWQALRRRIITGLQSAAVHMHDSVMQTTLLARTLGHPALSSREIETLKWTAAGKTQQDIGDILSISSRTVEVHLRSAREKLHALTTAQAVARAVGLGLVHPE